MPLFKRSDGDLVDDVPATRRIMPFLLPSRNESYVLFEQAIDVGPALEFIAQYNADHEARITLFHLVLWQIVRALADRPRLNRFTAGGRLYQRRGIWIAYSAKKAMSDDAPIVVLKQRFDPRGTFDDLVAQVHGTVRDGKSDRRSRVDKELDLLLRLPGPVLRRGVRLIQALYDWNLLPHEYMRGDPMFASVFVANLGSIKLDAAFHHHYEYGNIPIFLTIGRVHQAPVVAADGAVTTRTQAILKWNLDERIEDGLYCARALEMLRQRLENPDELT